MKKIKGRAESDEDKRQLIEKILKIWIEWPHLRLGQLMINSFTRVNSFTKKDSSAPWMNDPLSLQRRIFNIEDEKLGQTLERFGK